MDELKNLGDGVAGGERNVSWDDKIQEKKQNLALNVILENGHKTLELLNTRFSSLKICTIKGSVMLQSEGLSTPAGHYLLSHRQFLGTPSPAQADRIDTVHPMFTSKFSDAKGNCSKEIGDHGDAQNHGLVNNQTLLLHQSNQSVDGADSFLLGTPTNGVPFQSIENQLPMSAEPESAVIKVENQSLMISQTPVQPRSPHPSDKKLGKRKADVKESAKHAKEFRDGCKRLKNANTSLKESLVPLKNRGNELTDEVTNLAMHVLEMESNRSENQIQLQERIVQLQARNAQQQAGIAQQQAGIAQQRAGIAQLENESNANDQVNQNKENDSELGQAKN